MTPQEFLDQFGTLAEAEGGVSKLRELILELAVQGKLLPKTAEDQALLARDTTVGDFLTMQNGYAFKSQWFEKAGIRLVRNANIGHGELNWSDAAMVSEERAEEFERFALSEGDIVLSLDRPLITTGLKVARIRDQDLPSLLLQRVARPVFNDSSVASDYFYLWLQSPAFTSSIDPGKSNGVPHIATRDVLKLRFSPPTEVTQHRIVAKVDEMMRLCDGLEAVQQQRRGVRLRLNRSSLDRLTSVSSQAEVSAAWQRVCDHFQVLYDTPETLPDLRQTILQLAVQGKLVKQDPNDEPAEVMRERLANCRRNQWEGLELAKLVARRKEPVDDKWKKRLEPIAELESNGFHSLPRSWAWVPVEEVGAVQLGRQRAPRYANGPNMTPYLRVQNIHEDRMDLNDVKEMEFDAADTATFKLQYNDILLNEGQSTKLVGRPAIYRDEVPGACFQNTLVRFRHYKDVLPEYALIVFRHYMRGRFQEICQQTTNIAHLGASRFARLEFPLPPLPEQKRIVSKVTDLLSQVTRLESTLTRREATRTQLLTAAIDSILNSEGQK